MLIRTENVGGDSRVYSPQSSTEQARSYGGTEGLALSRHQSAAEVSLSQYLIPIYQSDLMKEQRDFLNNVVNLTVQLLDESR